MSCGDPRYINQTKFKVNFAISGSPLRFLLLDLGCPSQQEFIKKFHSCELSLTKS